MKPTKGKNSAAPKAAPPAAPAKPAKKPKVEAAPPPAPAPAPEPKPKLIPDSQRKGKKAKPAAPPPVESAEVEQTPEENPLRKVAREARERIEAAADEVFEVVEAPTPIGGDARPKPKANTDNPVPNNPHDKMPLPQDLAENDLFVNHKLKRVAGHVVRLFPRQMAVTLQSQLGIRQIFQYGFLAKAGYVHEKPAKAEELKTAGYTNTMDIKRTWQDPKPFASQMPEEQKEKLRKLAKEKREQDKADNAANPKGPKPPKKDGPKGDGFCLCGCKRETKSWFAPGHDVRLKKLVFSRSEMTPAQMDYAINAHWVPEELKNEIRKRRASVKA